MRRQSIGLGERDDDDHRVTEVPQVFAHGEHVFLAGQSSEVAVQYQHHRTATVGAQHPRPPVLIDQLDVGDGISETKGHALILVAVSGRRASALCSCHGGHVIDGRLRDLKDRLLVPVAVRLPAALTPARLTFASLVASLGAAALAAGGWRWWALATWLGGRLLDGLDGAVARRLGQQTDLGGYLDLMGDTVGYAAIPIAIAISQGDADVWAACAVLLGSFYLNTMSWTLLSAIAEKRSQGAAALGERTTFHMPTGLIEGAETIVLFSLMLALPDHAVVLFGVMAALVALTVVQRVSWAYRSIGRAQGQ